MAAYSNPFRPGAGHPPPYLAGRAQEKNEFARLLEQQDILENMVLTGLRGVGKTVLLESLKPLAIEKGWIWVGTDLSESTSVREDHIAIRLLTDLSPITSSVVVSRRRTRAVGFGSGQKTMETALTYQKLIDLYQGTPGLALDKLKGVLESVWAALAATGNIRGVIFAYDEAQTLADHADKEQFPLSLLLDAFQSLQRKGMPLMLVLTGLPTLFPKLVEARTYAERMFRVVFLEGLSEAESRDAILRPIDHAECEVRLKEQSVKTIISMSGGYPYFIQFICKEVYDAAIQRLDRGEDALVPVSEIEHKLDADFFAGRWARATDRQRTLLSVIARLDNSEGEFTVQEVVEKSRKELAKPFSSSHTHQMLTALANQGLVFKNRHGRYSFAVPLLDRYILRQQL